MKDNLIGKVITYQRPDSGDLESGEVFFRSFNGEDWYVLVKNPRGGTSHVYEKEILSVPSGTCGNLVGRIVGFRVPHLLDPSQVKPGKPLEIERTVWGRVKYPVRNLPGMFAISLTAYPEGPAVFVKAERFHTVMPESY